MVDGTQALRGSNFPKCTWSLGKRRGQGLLPGDVLTLSTLSALAAVACLISFSEGGGARVSSRCGVLISPGSPAWPAPEGPRPTGGWRWGGGILADLEQNGNNMASQYLLATKKQENLLQAKVGVGPLPGAP